MGFLSFLSKAIATKIGVVVGGDYKGAYVGYGTKSKKTTISFGNHPTDNDAIIIFAKPEVRFGKEDIESYSVQSSSASTTTYSIIFKNGKKSLLEILNQHKHRIDSALF